MKNLLKYLKQSVLAIFMVFILLVIQAYCDLALPGYTSDMVNIGIQESGIESSIPNVISKNKLDSLLVFTSDKYKILNNYKKLEKNNNNTDKYPLLEKEDIYILKKDYNKKILTKFFENAFTIDSFLTQNKNLKIEDSNLDQYKKKINNIESSLKSQTAKAAIISEYKKIGIDTNKSQTDYIVKTGIKMLAFALLSMIITIIVAYLAAKISSSLGKRLRDDVFQKVIGFSSSEFKNFGVASLITRSTNDITQIQMLIVMLIRVVFYAPIMAVGGIIKVLNTNTKMTWIIAVGVALVLFAVMILFIVSMPKFKKLQKLIDKVNLVSRELLSGLSVVRAFTKEKHEEQRFDSANNDLMKTNLFINRTMALMMPVMMLIMNLITVTIVWVGASHIDNGTMQVGDMMAFMQYTLEIVMSFLMISIVSIILPRALVSINRINEVITTKNIIKDPINPKNFDNSKKGYVEFKNVSFRYPDANNDVISDITFTAKPGETTALIGSTGSGKSTVVNLIPRFFDTTSGEILVNGINIKEVNIHQLRDKIGFVPQHGTLFSGTVKSNIAYGKKKVSKKQIDEALKISQSKDFVSKLKKGIYANISQSGKNISGGQKQRLSIARAIVKNPEIYIFDDSFSALDFKTDSKLRHELKKVTTEKTVLIVAQRISTIINAEQIIVLDEGKIAGIGTHKELMKKCEVYRQIALSQLSSEEVEHA